MPVRRRHGLRRLLGGDPDVEHLGPALADRLDPRQGQERLGQPADPLRVLGQPPQEVLARLGVVLGAGAAGPRPRRRCRRSGCAARAPRSRRTPSRRSRGAARRCGRGPPPAPRPRPGSRAPAARRRARRSAGRRARPSRRAARPPQPRDQRRRDLAVRVDQRPRRRVREPHAAVRADDHDRVGERVEDRREAVALGAQRLERLAQRRAHRLERLPQLGDLVAAARALERLVELALADLRGALGQALDPGRDRARDQERDRDGDQHRDAQGGDPVAAHGVDRLLQLRRARGPHEDGAVERRRRG